MIVRPQYFFIHHSATLAPLSLPPPGRLHSDTVTSWARQQTFASRIHPPKKSKNRHYRPAVALRYLFNTIRTMILQPGSTELRAAPALTSWGGFQFEGGITFTNCNMTRTKIIWPTTQMLKLANKDTKARRAKRTFVPNDWVGWEEEVQPTAEGAFGLARGYAGCSSTGFWWAEL